VGGGLGFPFLSVHAARASKKANLKNLVLSILDTSPPFPSQFMTLLMNLAQERHKNNNA